MSYDKLAKQQRISNRIRVIKKHVSDWNNYPHGTDRIKPSNKWAKRNAFNCGRSGCFMCCNPRRTWGHLTLAEQAANEAFMLDMRFVKGR
jgi:hypothetical protein|uniref:Uncharacterized protein n=1 Tax=Myoviridae sp. ctshb19 TaxID=2825194 RepID=A0A8S5UGT8_9CAUD|nr:MAG TPA: hypothetical protein [Myoviridae sp. ctshb19]